MTFNHSKLLLTIFSFLTLVVLAILVLEIYQIRFKNIEISELVSLAGHNTEMEMIDQSIGKMQNSALEDIKAFDGIVLSSNRLVPLIESIEKRGQALGLEAKIISVDKLTDAKSSGLDKIRIVMETRGPWMPTFYFIRAIESLPHRVIMDETSLSKEEDIWRLKIILSLYSFN